MRFVWDEIKSRANRAKHGISFDVAQEVFFDPNSLTQFDREADREERWHTMGMIGATVVLLVVHSYFDEEDELVTRIISARKATRAERHAYEKNVEENT
jgi:uncharacterized DUF497 family protein